MLGTLMLPTWKGRSVATQRRDVEEAIHVMHRALNWSTRVSYKNFILENILSKFVKFVLDNRNSA